MNEKSLPRQDSLPLDVLQGIDQVCRRFEAAWKAGSRPRIEDFLGDTPEPARTELRRELAAVDAEYRKSQSTVSVETFLQRLNDSGLMTAAECRQWIEQIPAERRPSSGEELARELYRQGKLTQFQAKAIYQGRSAGLVVDNYVVLEQIGEGGMGFVCLARDDALNRNVALKNLHPTMSDKDVHRRRFVGEAQITGQLEHPGIVPIYGLGTDRRGHPFYAMRLVRGKTLKVTIAEVHSDWSATGLRTLLRRFVAIGQTMAFAHARGVVHRDLKPANIMLGEYGETLVMDWGLARPMEEEARDSTLGDVAARAVNRPEITQSGEVVGTPSYMPPEQVSGEPRPIGPAFDIYSLGAVLYEILTGHAPYAGGSAIEVIEKVRTAPPERPSHLNRQVPPALEAICLKAMARAPGERYPSAQALVADVQNWLDDEPVAAHRASFRERVFRWTRKHKNLAVNIGISVVVLALVVTAGGLIFANERARTLAAMQLAQEYAREAANARAKADANEAETARLAEEARKAREQAASSIVEVAQAEARIVEAKARISALEADLTVKVDQTQTLREQLEAARTELASAEAAAKAERERATTAVERTRSLDKEVERLTTETRELRLLAARLAELATGSAAASGISEPGATFSLEGDFTEQAAENFDVSAEDQTPCVLTSDTAEAHAGRQSLRLDAMGTSDVCVTYPKSRHANWDLSKKQTLRIAFRLADPGFPIRFDGVRIRLGRGSCYLQCRAQAEILRAPRGQWAQAIIPLNGDSDWTRTDMNAPDLSHIDWIEIHVGGEKPGLRLWLDALAFEPERAIAPFDATRAKQLQEAWADYLGVPAETIDSLGMAFVLVPPGEFMMGADDPESQPREKPVHKVQITKPFYLGKYPVTVADFRRFIEATGYKTNGENRTGGYAGWALKDARWQKVDDMQWNRPGFDQTPHDPVVLVSPVDAQEYCHWVTATTGRVLRLPTEAEWEFATRGPASAKYPWGNRWDGTLANHADRSLRKTGYTVHSAAMEPTLQYPGYDQNYGGNEDDGYAYTSPVGTFTNASWCGVYDLVGNVWQWCSDRLGDGNYYASSPPSDPPGFSAGLTIRRGGGWPDDPAMCRAAQRFGGNADERDAATGFRVVMEAPSEPQTTGMADAQGVAPRTMPTDSPLSQPATPSPAVAPFDASQAREYQEAWAQYLGVPAETIDSIGMALVLIPPGTFMMGSSTEEIHKQLAECRDMGEVRKEDLSWLVPSVRSQGPLHRVKLSQPFYLGKHEVTVGQFREFVNATGWKTDAERDGLSCRGFDATTLKLESKANTFTWQNPGFTQIDSQPVSLVSRHDAEAFCKWLSDKEKCEYRLSTEAEWEFACRAGTESPWCFGRDAESVVQYANIFDASLKAVAPNADWAMVSDPGSDGFAFTSPVGSLKPNQFGLHDMHGNLTEWCSDWYGEDFFQQSPDCDPQGPPSGEFGVTRGGTWDAPGTFARSAVRGSCDLRNHNAYIGFRVVCVPNAGKATTTEARETRALSGGTGRATPP